MKYWTECKIGEYPVEKVSRETICDVIFTFDTETTSYFSRDGKQWEYLAPNSDISAYPFKCGIVYIWTFSINDTVYYGRTLEEFKRLIVRLRALNSAKFIIYVHNLGYDFQFLRNIFNFDTVFARKAYRPIYAICSEYNLEFRCSYYLTNLSLANAAKEYGNRPKKAGDLDYNKPRIPKTPLTETELGYCEYDCLALYDVIAHFKAEYGNLVNIPLTSTGRVRRVVKERLTQNDYDYMRRIKRQYPDFENYTRLAHTLIGGYTSANYLYVSDDELDIIEDVVSVDKASSYPYVMVTKRYPCSAFKQVNVDRINDKNNRRHYCYYGKIAMSNFVSRMAMCYISDSKAYNKKNCETNNGRIFQGDYLEMFVTDIDYDIIRRNYEGNIQWLALYESRKQYLSKAYIDYILELYENKTSLKNIEEKAAIYALSKTYINALYGMMCTNNLRDELFFNSDFQWDIKELSDTQIKERLADMHPFLNFSWGVWVLAYARAELWRVIFAVGNDNVYNDTDSSKIVHFDEHKADIDRINTDILEELKRAATDLQIPLSKFMPKDKEGIAHPLGLFEIDGRYKTFATYGAKNYAYTLEDESFHFTISGMAKTRQVRTPTEDDDGKEPTMKSMSQYRKGKSFPSARKSFFYCDNQQKGIILTDFEGREFISNYRYGIAMIDTTYTIGQSKDYVAFLNAHQITRNKFTDIISQLISGIDDL